MAGIEDRIAKGDFNPVYLLEGEEPFLSDRIIAALRDQLVPPAFRSMNVESLEAETAGATGILNTTRTMPMLGGRRLVVVHDVGELGAALAELVPYLENPSPHSVLVLLVAKADGRLKFFQTAKRRGYLHKLEAPRPLPPWIRREAERRGVAIDEDAARLLAEIIGADLSRLSQVIDQLALYAGGRAVTTADVNELVAETRERTVFELTAAIGQGARPRALRAVARLFDQRESSIALVVMIARHVRHLALAKEHLGRRTPTRDLAQIIGVPPFAVNAIVAQTRRFELDDLGKALVLLARADRDLKGPVKGALGERIVVERLVENLLDLGRG